MTTSSTARTLKPRHKRLILAAIVLAAVAAIVALVLNAFQSNLVFFFSPSQVVSKEAPVGKTFRLGGMVEEGSVKRDGTKVHFVVTDTVQKVPVQYVGILPDLFQARRELHAARSGRSAEAGEAGRQHAAVGCGEVAASNGKETRCSPNSATSSSGSRSASRS